MRLYDVTGKNLISQIHGNYNGMSGNIVCSLIWAKIDEKSVRIYSYFFPYLFFKRKKMVRESWNIQDFTFMEYLVLLKGVE